MSNTITKRERVRRSVYRKSLDAIPWQMDLTRAVEDKLKAYYRTTDLHAATGDHIVWVKPQTPSNFIAEKLEPGLMQTEFGDVWRMNYETGNWGELVSAPLSEPSLTGYAFPDGALPGRWDHARDLRVRYPDHFLVAHFTAIFERAWSICGGIQNYLVYVASEEKFVEELTEKLTDYACHLIRQLDGLDFDGVRLGDDWGFQTRLMIRPDTWRRIFKKYYRRIFETTKQVGLVAMMHSCGHLNPILPDLIEIGLQVYHPLQHEAMDVELCKREFGKDIAFWGGLGTQSTLPLGTVEDVRNQVRQRIELFRDGGYIVAPAGAISPETPVENVVAIVETAQEQFS